MTIAGWLGGELVFKHGVAVTAQASSRARNAAAYSGGMKMKSGLKDDK